MDIKLDADKAKLLLNDPKLNNIIDAVGETAAQIDRDLLRRDLLIRYAKYSRALAGQPGTVKRQIDRLNSIQKHARKLVELLKNDDADLKIIKGEWPLNRERPAHLLPQMIFLVELVDMMKGAKEKPGYIAEWIKTKLGMSGSALQELINSLPTIYAKHFGHAAGISRVNGHISGPFFRFVRQILIEMEIKCSDEAIAKYFYHGKFRKK